MQTVSEDALEKEVVCSQKNSKQTYHYNMPIMLLLIQELCWYYEFQLVATFFISRMAQPSGALHYKLKLINLNLFQSGKMILVENQQPTHSVCQ